MGQLKQLFTEFLEKESLFKNKEALRPGYLPETLLHRTHQTEQLATILAPILKDETPSNILITGLTGVGKTAVVKHVCTELGGVSKTSTKHTLSILYFNCKMNKINTEYRLLASLVRELGTRVPKTGLPTSEVYDALFKAINNHKATYLVVLDEADAMEQASSALYNLTRINDQLVNRSRVCVICISNKLNFMDSIDPKVRSSFAGEELHFPQYNAPQLSDILAQRAAEAFTEAVLEPGVIEKCAALAAQEHGDARRALNLLRVAAEVADRRGAVKLTPEHVNIAEERIDVEAAMRAIQTLPRQSQALLWTVIRLRETTNNKMATGDVFDEYTRVCESITLTPLTHRRVSDLLSELDTLGIIATRVVSKGRYGRTRDISLAIGGKALLKTKQILREELLLE